MPTKNSRNRKKWFDENQLKLSEKFPQGHWFSNQDHVENFILWVTFYRRNLHLFARDYLGLKLHWYQSIVLYLMGISHFIVIIAARASAKSFIISIYASCISILYPGSEVVLTSGTRGQSKLIVTKKIQGELLGKNINSPLHKEIIQIKDNQTEVLVKFAGGSQITTVTCNENARGNRSTVNIGEEARQIDKKILDKVISPFQISRQTVYYKDPFYADNPELIEQPVDILISSSMEDSHWLYKSAVEARNGMFKGDGSFFVAFDVAITMKHNIRTKEWLQKEHKKADPITWKIEYENAVLRENTNALFTYDLMKNAQQVKRAAYPRQTSEIIANQRYKYKIPKMADEIRVVSCDIAFVDKTANDNSCFSCLRFFNSTEELNGHKEQKIKVQIPYIETQKGGDLVKQAIRIRQLFNDFEADYIVLDCRNAGISVYESLAKVLYDDERGVEYPPLKCMNDPVLANRINNPSASPVIYSITASQKLNSDMALNFYQMLNTQSVELLVNKEDGLTEICKYISEYTATEEPIVKMFYESPYIETMLLIYECVNLMYERLEQTGVIRIRERPSLTKDRYVSVAMGCYFISELARDLQNYDEQISFDNADMCVSAISF